MPKRNLRGIIAFLVTSIFPAAAQLPSAPQNPPIFSAMTAIGQGSSIELLQSSLRGPVAEVKKEEFNNVDKNSAPRNLTTTKYDDRQRVIEEITEDAIGNMRKTTNLYQGALLQSEITAWSGKTGSVETWRRWSYDSAGRVSDLRIGRGTALNNHFLNYRYDSMGRPVSWEYRQGASDELQIRTQIKY